MKARGIPRTPLSLFTLLGKAGLFRSSSRSVLASEKDVTRIYQTLLKRTPENDTVWVGTPLLDCALSVATSPERALVAAREFDKQYTEQTRVCLSKTNNGHIITYTADKVIGESIRRTGRFEEADINDALLIIESMSRPVPRSTFLDIGANIATHCLFALKHGFDKAICIEADDDNFKLLRINQILNDVDHRCVNFLVALSNHDGAGKLEISPTNFGDHRLRPVSAGVEFHDEQNRLSKNVKIMRLDTLIESEKINPQDFGIAWIDIQGHEGHMLAGAQTLLNAGTPIVAEFWPCGLERSGGYKLFRDAVSRRKVYDLRQSMTTARPRQLTMDHLDELYERLRRSDKRSVPAHTDLILL